MFRSDNLDCAKLLIEVDKDCVNYTDFMWRTPLHLSSVYCNDFKLMILLLENGADVNARYVTCDFLSDIFIFSFPVMGHYELYYKNSVLLWIMLMGVQAKI